MPDERQALAAVQPRAALVCAHTVTILYRGPLDFRHDPEPLSPCRLGYR